MFFKSLILMMLLSFSWVVMAEDDLNTPLASRWSINPETGEPVGDVFFESQQPWRDINERMPKDILRLILRHLGPRDLARMAQVNESWNEAINLPVQWKSILPLGSIQNEAELITELLGRGNFELAETMLNDRNDHQNIVQKALEIAVKNLDSERTEKLVEMGGSLFNTLVLQKSSENNPKVYPLIWAIRKNDIGFFKKLIELGADIYGDYVITNIFRKFENEGETEKVNVIQMAAQWSEEAVLLLLRHNQYYSRFSFNLHFRSPLHYAALSSHSETERVIRRLIKYGYHLEDKDSSGNTPLHVAAGVGNSKGVKFLYQAGANLNSKNNKGYTPVGYAARFGNPETLKVFLNELPSFNINQEYYDDNSYKGTLLHFAAMNPDDASSVAMIQLLVKAGADIHIANRINADYANSANYANLHFVKMPYTLAKEAKNFRAAELLENLARSASR